MTPCIFPYHSPTYFLTLTKPRFPSFGQTNCIESIWDPLTPARSASKCYIEGVLPHPAFQLSTAIGTQVLMLVWQAHQQPCHLLMTSSLVFIFQLSNNEVEERIDYARCFSSVSRLSCCECLGNSCKLSQNFMTLRWGLGRTTNELSCTASLSNMPCYSTRVLLIFVKDYMDLQ